MVQRKPVCAAQQFTKAWRSKKGTQQRWKALGVVWRGRSQKRKPQSCSWILDPPPSCMCVDLTLPCRPSAHSQVPQNHRQYIRGGGSCPAEVQRLDCTHHTPHKAGQDHSLNWSRTLRGSKPGPESHFLVSKMSSCNPNCSECLTPKGKDEQF